MTGFPQALNKIYSLTRHGLLTKPCLVKFLLRFWFSVNWSWVLFTDSAKLAGSQATGFIFAVFFFVAVVSISTLVMWQCLRMLNRICRKHKQWVTILLIVPVFATADFLVSWLTTIIWFGPQGSFDSIAPVGSPTLLLVHTPLKFAARILGFYGLSAIAWSAIYVASRKPLRRYLPHFSAGVVLVTLLGWGLYHAPAGHAYPVKVVAENLQKRIPAVHPGKAELIVFPEYGFDDITNDNLTSRIVGTNSRTNFIGSKQVGRPDLTGHINRMVVGNTRDGITRTQDKHRLIPNGEDASYVGRFLMHVTGQEVALDYFSLNRQVIKGSQQLTPIKLSKDITLGSAICSSITVPDDYRDLTRAGATLLTNSASLDIFSGSRIFAWQQKSLASFVAVSNARPFIQSANDAASFVLSSNGETVSERKAPGVLDSTVVTNSRLTLYARTGEWLVVAGMMALVYEVSKLRYRRN